VLVHRIQLEARETELDDAALELIDRRPNASVRGIHRPEPDESIGIRANDRRHVVVASVGVLRFSEPEHVARIDGPDQPALEVLRRDPEDDDLVEAGVITDALVGPDDRPALPRVATRLPLLLCRLAM
jgi:hypothetical protein